MILFDFSLEDDEAEILFSCISDDITKSTEAIMELTAQSQTPSTEQHIKWHRGYIQKLNDIKSKMKNIKG